FAPDPRISGPDPLELPDDAALGSQQATRHRVVGARPARQVRDSEQQGGVSDAAEHAADACRRRAPAARTEKRALTGGSRAPPRSDMRFVESSGPGRPSRVVTTSTTSCA